MKEKKSVLIVENEPLLTKTFEHLLALWGYRTRTAKTGVSALEWIRQGAIDLVLLDHTLPDMPGLTVLKQIKKEMLSASLPIILLIEKRTFRRELIQEKTGPDDYLMKPVDPLDLRLRLDMVLQRTEKQFHANPLTKLPGNPAIEKEIETRIEKNVPFSVCHLDIDNFKAFNDAYGYHRGNSVIQQTCRIILNAVQSQGNESDFVGHIGGDDFIIITTPDREEPICLLSIQEFDRLIPLHYRKEDRKRGVLYLKNRLGKSEQFPLMTLSIAVVNNKKRSLQSALQVSEIASEIKKFLKMRPGAQSRYLIDRRTERSQGKEARSTASPPIPRIPKPKKVTKPLGQLLLDAKILTPEQLEEALARHWRSACRLGQVLLEMNLVAPDTLGQLLSDQKETIRESVAHG
ncbi:MAG: response regulator [Candidatus Omnitrophica bacterium]|nr:response regulator [Candidatus Omnitrophota bacterium]